MVTQLSFSMQDYRALVARSIIQRYGESVNIKGIIVVPRASDCSSGYVVFNVMSHDSAMAGRHSLSYSIGSQGDVTLKPHLD
jgi:hypothetical protein